MRKTIQPTVLLADGFSPADTVSTRHQIAFKDDMTVWLARADGREKRALFQEVSYSLNCPLAWSPDGQTLYQSHGQIYAIDVATGTSRAVTSFPEEEQGGVVWHLACSPDGDALSFFQHEGIKARGQQPGRHRLCTIGIDGNSFRIVAEELPDTRLWQVTVSWQSRQCLLTGINPGGGTGFWKQDLDGSGLTFLKQVRFGASLPVFSPDGRHAVYADEGLHVIALEDGHIRQISRFGRVPSWSPDGGRIAFMDADHELWVVTAEGKQPQKLAWFGGRNNFSQRNGSYAQTPLWSADGWLLWFSLTKTRRLRSPKNPDFLTRLQGMEHHQKLPSEQQQQSLQAAARRQLWDFIHINGVLDFADKKVWTSPGYWSNAAWSPKGAAQNSTHWQSPSPSSSSKPAAMPH